MGEVAAKDPDKASNEADLQQTHSLILRSELIIRESSLKSKKTDPAKAKPP